MTKPDNKISEQDMLDSLERSGYLLESEITKKLSDYNFFVESNITSLDPFTGKSREIDLLAEYNHFYEKERYENKTIAFARFVFEIKNNNSPIVLLTKYENSPNSEIYTGLKSMLTIPVGLEDLYYSDFFDVLFIQETKDLFTQYCSFSKKKSEELMAHHPENIYSGLLKITHFCEEMTNQEEHEAQVPADDYFRNFLYLPILLINDDLYELHIDENNQNVLKKTECSYLIFNYHYKQEPMTSIVHVVTKIGLDELLKEILKAEKKVQDNMYLAKKEFLNKQS